MKNLYQIPRELILRQDVWNKGFALGGNSNPELYRLDAYGAVMQWDAFELTGHKYGWVFDFRDGNSANSVLANLVPVYWKNQRSKSPDDSAEIYYAFCNQAKKNSRLLRCARQI